MRTLRATFERAGVNARVAMVFVKFLAIVTALYLIALIAGGWQIFGNSRTDVLEAFFIAFGGNLTFLIVVGLVPTILAFSEPGKEPVQRRVDYLITNADVSQGARAQIKKDVIKLCAYFESVEVCVRVTEVRDDGAFYAEFLTDSLLRNTFQGDQYSDPEYDMMIEPDPVALDPGAVYGEIILAEVISNDAQSTPIIAKPERIRTPGRYDRRFGINVPAGGTSRVRVNFRIWCDGSLAVYYYFYQYAENARIILENLTQQDLYISKPDKNDEIEGVAPSQSSVLFNGPVKKVGQKQIFTLVQNGR